MHSTMTVNTMLMDIMTIMATTITCRIGVDWHSCVMENFAAPGCRDVVCVCGGGDTQHTDCE